MLLQPTINGLAKLQKERLINSLPREVTTQLLGLHG